MDPDFSRRLQDTPRRKTRMEVQATIGRADQTVPDLVLASTAQRKLREIRAAALEAKVDVSQLQLRVDALEQAQEDNKHLEKQVQVLVEKVEGLQGNDRLHGNVIDEMVYHEACDIIKRNRSQEDMRLSRMQSLLSSFSDRLSKVEDQMQMQTKPQPAVSADQRKLEEMVAALSTRLLQVENKALHVVHPAKLSPDHIGITIGEFDPAQRNTDAEEDEHTEDDNSKHRKEGTASSSGSDQAKAKEEKEHEEEEGGEEEEDKGHHWIHANENAYGAFVHVGHHEGFLSALEKAGGMLLVSFAMQAIFSYELWSELPTVYQAEHYFCKMPATIQLCAVGVYITLMFQNIPVMLNSGLLAMVCTAKRESEEEDDAESNTHAHHAISTPLLLRGALFAAAVLTEVATWLALLYVGIVFILTAVSVELIIRSTVSIIFILQVDEIIFSACSSHALRQSMSKTEYRVWRGPHLSSPRLVRLGDNYASLAQLCLLATITVGIVIGLRTSAEIQCASWGERATRNLPFDKV